MVRAQLGELIHLTKTSEVKSEFSEEALQRNLAKSRETKTELRESGELLSEGEGNKL